MRVTERIFKLTQIHTLSRSIRFPEFTKFPFHLNSVSGQKYVDLANFSKASSDIISHQQVDIKFTAIPFLNQYMRGNIKYSRYHGLTWLLWVVLSFRTAERKRFFSFTCMCLQVKGQKIMLLLNRTFVIVDNRVFCIIIPQNLSNLQKPIFSHFHNQELLK